MATTAAALWIPLAAQVTPATIADQAEAPALVRTLDPQIRYILGDTHYNDPNLRLQCEQEGRCLVATQSGTQARTDPGAKVRQIFHRLRSKAIEPFNALFKNVFEWGGQVPVRGLRRTQLFVLGAVLLYQLVWLYQFEHHLPLGKRIKPLLRAA